MHLDLTPLLPALGHHTLLALDWVKMFQFDTPPLEIIIRGALTYLSIFVLFRVLRRETGALSVADILVVVLIADASQNAMTGGYKSFTDGLLLIVTILFCSLAINWLGYHFRWFERLTSPRPLRVIDEGRLNLDGMREQLLTRDELMGQLRAQGIERISDVKAAYVEADGQLSIIPFEKNEKPKPKKKGAQPT